MTEQKILELARQRLADMWSADYAKHAILAGEWDEGRLMKNMVIKVAGEVMSHMPEEVPDD